MFPATWPASYLGLEGLWNALGMEQVPAVASEYYLIMEFCSFLLADAFPAFPFTPYSIQMDFMKELYAVLERGGIGLFESPTGG